MAIMVAIQKYNRVKAYNEDNKEFLNIKGELYGYNDNYVAVKTNESQVDIYDEDGQFVKSFSL